MMLLPAFATFKALPRWAHGLIAIAAAVAAFLAWDWLDDRAAIREHEREIAEEVERLDAIADGEARAVADEARTDAAARQAQTEKAMTDAEHANPEDARKPAGPVSRAVADSLRR